MWLSSRFMTFDSDCPASLPLKLAKPQSINVQLQFLHKENETAPLATDVNHTTYEQNKTLLEIWWWNYCPSQTPDMPDQYTVKATNCFFSNKNVRSQVNVNKWYLVSESNYEIWRRRVVPTTSGIDWHKSKGTESMPHLFFNQIPEYRFNISHDYWSNILQILLMYMISDQTERAADIYNRSTPEETITSDPVKLCKREE